METVVRSVIAQPFSSFAIAVGTTPTPILPISNKADLINSFILSLDAAAANNVFIGDQGVTITSGLEIVRGAGPVQFLIEDERQQYELQIPLFDFLDSYQCPVRSTPFGIPFIVWDLSQIYLIAAAATNVRCVAFRTQFV